MLQLSLDAPFITKKTMYITDICKISDPATPYLQRFPYNFFVKTK